eukprot:Hpha_TRINITY_DN1249_c0_g1::TRINITY_DN1249_c0_g1_i1::g.44725::m.44725
MAEPARDEAAGGVAPRRQVHSCGEALAEAEYYLRQLANLAVSPQELQEAALAVTQLAEALGAASTDGDGEVEVCTACQPYGELAPDWPSHFRLEDEKWPSVDHYFQAHKFEADTLHPHFGRPIRAVIRGLTFGDDVLRVGRDPELGKLLRPEWDEVRVDTMETALRAVFEQAPRCRARLLSTGNRRIVCTDARPPFGGHPFWSKGGQNTYGMLLEKLRAELRQTPVEFAMPDAPNGELSTHYPAALLADGKTWPTVEHYYQAQKFHPGPHQEEVRKCATALQAHNLGREARVNRPFRIDWDAARLGVMLQGLRYRCLASRVCREALLATGTRRLVYTGWPEVDGDWCTGYSGDWSNWLGRVTEIVRAEFADYRRPSTHFGPAATAYMSVPAIAAKAEGQVAVSEFNYLRSDFVEGTEVHAGEIGPQWSTRYSSLLEKRMSIVWDARGAEAKLYGNGFEYVHANSAIRSALLRLRPLPKREERREAVSQLHAALRAWLPHWWGAQEEKGRPAATDFLPLDAIVRSTQVGAAFGPVGLVHLDFPSTEEARESFPDWPQPPRGARVVDMVNLWWPLDEMCKGHPLATLDVGTMDAKLHRAYGAKRSGGQCFRAVGTQWEPGHRWYSRKDWEFGCGVVFRSSVTPHTAFHDGTDSHRRSVEVRVCVLA